jgi:hypothetical protein
VTAVRGSRARRRQPALAVEAWLLAAAADADLARAGWQEHGVALLRCGGEFTAVRIPAAVVTAAVGNDATEDVAARLALLGGGVFAVPRYGYFYALTPSGQAARWREPDSEVLAPDTYIGVPAVDRIGPAGGGGFGAYWVVPPMPRVLCDASALAGLVRAGRSALAKTAGAAGGENHA